MLINLRFSSPSSIFSYSSKGNISKAVELCDQIFAKDFSNEDCVNFFEYMRWMTSLEKSETNYERVL